MLGLVSISGVEGGAGRTTPVRLYAGSGRIAAEIEIDRVAMAEVLVRAGMVSSPPVQSSVAISIVSPPVEA